MAVTATFATQAELGNSNPLGQPIGKIIIPFSVAIADKPAYISAVNFEIKRIAQPDEIAPQSETEDQRKRREQIIKDRDISSTTVCIEELTATASKANYQIVLDMPENKNGQFTIQATGKVFSGTMRQDFQSPIYVIPGDASNRKRTINYDTRVPIIEIYYPPSYTIGQKFDVLLGFNVPVSGLNPDDFEFQGAMKQFYDVDDPLSSLTLYAYTKDPFPNHKDAQNGNDAEPWKGFATFILNDRVPKPAILPVDDWAEQTNQTRYKFFLMRFSNVASTAKGVASILLKDDNDIENSFQIGSFFDLPIDSQREGPTGLRGPSGMSGSSGQGQPAYSQSAPQPGGIKDPAENEEEEDDSNGQGDGSGPVGGQSGVGGQQSTDPPVIPNISQQTLYLNEASTITLPALSGNITSVVVDGEYIEPTETVTTGFYYTYNSSTKVVTIRGTPVKLSNDKNWTLTATGADGTAVAHISYEVIHRLPVIGTLPTQTLIYTVPYTILVPISNIAVDVKVRGILVGSIIEPGDNGVTISGNITRSPIDSSWPSISDTFTITAENTAGEVSRTFNVNLSAGNRPGSITRTVDAYAGSRIIQILIPFASSQTNTGNPILSNLPSWLEPYAEYYNGVYRHFIRNKQVVGQQPLFPTALDIGSYPINVTYTNIAGSTTSVLTVRIVSNPNAPSLTVAGQASFTAGSGVHWWTIHPPLVDSNDRLLAYEIILPANARAIRGSTFTVGYHSTIAFRFNVYSDNIPPGVYAIQFRLTSNFRIQTSTFTVTIT